MQALNKNNEVHKVKTTMILLSVLLESLTKNPHSMCVETLKLSSQERLDIYTYISNIWSNFIG